MHRLLSLVAIVTLAVLGAGGCGRAAVRGPAWPEPSTTAEDGGESLEPRPATTYAAAVERSAEPEPEPETASESAATPAAAAGEDKSDDATSEATSAGDDVLMTDEIIIEIDEE